MSNRRTTARLLTPAYFASLVPASRSAAKDRQPEIFLLLTTAVDPRR